MNTMKPSTSSPTAKTKYCCLAGAVLLLALAMALSMVGCAGTAAPEAPEGEVFVYWMSGDEIVSYNETYTFYMGLSDVYLKAVYASDSAKKEAVITMTDPVVLKGENRIAFMAERDLPDEYKLIESGILLGKSAGLSIDNAEHKAISASSAKNGQFTIRKANLESGDKWYAVAYLVYEANGKIYTIYSREVSATYSE